MRRGRPLLAAATSLAVLAAACSGGGSDDAGGPSTTTTAPGGTTSTTVRQEGVPLVVVEQGVTSFPDPYAAGQVLGGYGVVLENPDPGLLAAGVNVTTRILDAAGAELLVDRALLNGVMPGRRMAVGRTLVEPIAGAAQLDVAVEVNDWLVPAEGTGELQATEALTQPEPFGGAVTRFALRSDAGSDEDEVDVAALYRGADGTLLAVETTQVDRLPAGQVVVGQIRLLAPFPGTASTEVLVGRGLAAQVTG